MEIDPSAQLRPLEMERDDDVPNFATDLYFCWWKMPVESCFSPMFVGKTWKNLNLPFKFFLPLEYPILSREICLSKLLFAKSPAFWVTSPCLLSRSILQVWLLKSSYRGMKSGDFCWSNPNLWKLMDKLSKNCSIQIFWSKISSTFGKLRSVCFSFSLAGSAICDARKAFEDLAQSGLSGADAEAQAGY